MPSPKSDATSTTLPSSTMQPRFVRPQSNSTSSFTKPRFAPRSHLHPSPAHRLLHSFFSTLRFRRSKKATARATLLFVVVALIIAIFLLLRLFYPQSLDRLPIHVDDVRAGVLDLTHRALGGATQPVVHMSPPGHGRPVAVAAVENNVGEQLETLPVPAEVGSLRHSSVRRGMAAKKMSIVVLFHNEYDSLKYALKSWIEKGLIEYADEILFFLNGVRNQDTFVRTLTDYTKRIPEAKRSLHVSPENLSLGLAILKMVELAKHEYVLLLEKDWELIEQEPTMRSRLDDSKVIVGTGVAHLIRHRHRHNPGVPLHALIMHEGREESILRVQKNLLCYVHHWQKDPTISYPGQGIMRRCGGPDNNIEERDVYCSSSVYCQWTNNPCVFKKDWFINEVGLEYKKQYKIELDKHGKSSPFLDFEYYTNWRAYAWTDKNFTVAVGTGLFRHAETEHHHFNTFWYAHYRLKVDWEEIREQYLKNETLFKKLGGVHQNPDDPPPLTMMERYPVEFVRKYHVREMFTGNLATQIDMINVEYQQFLDKHRILTEEEWEASGGPTSAKATRQVNWRSGITNLHHIVEKAMMVAPPERPNEMSITLVTCLLDIGRDALAKDAYKFKREFQMYLDAMQKWLKHQYPKVVFTTEDVVDEMMKTMSDESKKTTKFVITSRDELRTKWLGRDNYDRVQTIRKSPEWLGRASWLPNSPQGGLEDYNPLVMSKMFMLREAARQNFFNTSHFIFLDSKHNCQNPDIVTPKNDHILRAHMFNKLLLTTFDYTPSTEVHGFEYKEFNQYCNMQNPAERQLIKVGRGGIFGGSAFVLEYIAAMYDIALTATLRSGLMGTEENILSILKYQVPQYVDDFNNNWACPDNLKDDHHCQSMKDHQGYNCAIFDWMARNAVTSST